MDFLDRLVEQDHELRRRIPEEELKLDVSQIVYDARTAAGLTQARLARKIGTTQSVISRLEDADYGGHSLAILQRIAEALDLRLEVELRELLALGGEAAPVRRIHHGEFARTNFPKE
jgi:transcriptional regulator with XRE-family HTH domain